MIKIFRCAFLAFFFALSISFTSSAATEGKLWVNTYAGALGLGLSASPQPHVVAGGYDIAVDQSTGNLWAYDGLSISSYQSDGISLASYPVNVYGAMSHLAVDSTIGNIWLTIENKLYIFDLTGTMLNQIELSFNNFQLNLDRKNQLLYLSDDYEVHVFNVLGEKLYTLDLLGGLSLRAFTLDPLQDAVLVLAGDKILRFDAAGNLISQADDSKLDYFKNLSADGRGGFWSASYDYVYHYDAIGGYDFESIGFKNIDYYGDIGTILTMIADPASDTVWLGSYYDLKHINLQGEELYSLNTYLFEGVERQIFKMKMYYGDGDSTPSTVPLIDITSPQNGSVFRDTAPQINLAFTSQQSTIDTTSLVLELNQIPVQLDCTVSQSAAQCLFVNFPGTGAHVLTASISNDLGEISLPASVQFEIGTNSAPVINSVPVLNVTAGDLYAYDVNATDTDGDPITYSLSAQAPSTMQIDGVSGLISWQTVSTDIGVLAIDVIATDSFGASDTQSFSLTVEEAFISVPDVVGAEQSVAEQTIVDNALVVGVVSSEFSSTVPQGTVISQLPLSGSLVNPGVAVNLVISAGPELTLVPDLVNTQVTLADGVLTGAALTLGTQTNEFSATVAAGRIISQLPIGGVQVEIGTAVDVVVSAGFAPVLSPNVVGMAQAIAQSTIISAGLSVGTISSSSSDSVAAGNVISQSPAAGTSVAAGSAVNLVVSSGPAPVNVPGVVGMAQATAQSAITSAGLTVGTISTANSDTVALGDVISQSPAAGTSVAAGSAVNLVVSSGPVPVSVPNVVGTAQASAESSIISAGLTVGVITIVNNEIVAAGDVISQSPISGALVAPGSVVNIVVSSGPSPVNVPGVVGMAQATAQSAITSAGLTVGTITTANSDTVAVGDVISQSPAAGTSVAAGSAVNLVVSSGPPPVNVPGVVGMAQATAQSAIISAGLTVGTITTANSDTVAVGDVVSQSPAAGTSVAAGSAVNLVVSSGPAPVNVPGVVGMAQATAQSAITSAGLTVGTISTANSDTVALGDVISQSPAAGISVAAGSAVNLVVSSGPAPVNVPGVVGMAQATAQSAITSAGLTVGTISTANSDTVALGDVISQSPVAGTSVAAGSTVNLVVSSGPAPVNVPGVVGMAQATAQSAITSAGLNIGTITTVSSDTVAAGDVISQSPAAGTSVAAGSAVNLVVSSGTAITLVAPLDVTVIANPQIIDLGGTTTVTVAGVGGAGSLTVALSVNGIDVALDVNGQVVLSGDVIGSNQLVATVTDATETLTSSSYFSVRDPSDVSGPIAAITTPVSLTEVTAPIDIVGTASDANLVEYILAYSPKDTNNFVTWQTGTTSVTNGVLGRFDPTTIANGVYDVVLQAVDVNGATTSTSITLEVVSDLKVGNFSFTVEDLSIPVSGIDIKVNRTYDTRRKAEDLDFGYGWSIDYQDVKVEENMVLGTNWTTSSTGGFIPTVCLQPVGRHTVSISLPDGDVEKFDMDVSPKCSSFAAPRTVDPVFNARPGTDSSLVAEDVGSLLVNGSQLLDVGTVDSYDPTRYTLTTKQGMVYRLNQNFGIESVTDRVGNVLTYSNAGIIHSSGKSILFGRDGQGRITRITDPMGNEINYEYSARGDLTAVTDQLNNRTLYSFNRSHGLIDVIDPLGRRINRNIYDDAGRLIAIEDADGNRTAIANDVDNLTETVTDKLGNVSVLQYDSQGNLLSEAGPLGRVTSYVYDANGNALTSTNALGDITTRTFDVSGDTLSEADALGNTIAKTNNTFGQLSSRTDALGNVTNYTYALNGNPQQTVDSDGNVTAFAFDTSGNLVSQTDAQGNVTTNTYDASGNNTSVTDALGNTTNMTYDANGNQLSTSLTRVNDLGQPEVVTYGTTFDALGREASSTDYLGNVESTEYDATGNVFADIDALGRRVEYVYDSQDNVIATNYSDGTSEQTVYDAQGKQIQTTDRAGRITTYRYNALSQLLETITPDGLSSQIEYDLESRITAKINPQGARTTYTYDAAGRVTSITDAFGEQVAYTYDANGRRLSETDALGRTTLFTYDTFGKVLRTTFSDASFTENTYDSLGNLVTTIDQLGRPTRYEYDAVGNLTRVIDAKGNATSYTYNERNNKTSETDANGNVTLWTFDAMGRNTSRTLPGGETETFAYDAVGNIVSHTDFNGDTTTLTYDDNDRVLTKTYADASQVIFTYLNDGQIDTVTDSRGITQHTYDTSGRPLRVDNPDGSFIEYAYGLDGRVSSMTQPSGTTTYQYDIAGRLVNVTDNQANTTVYSYNAVGKPDIVFLANGTQKIMTYDALNRITRIDYMQAATTIIASFEYTLDVAGKRVSAIETVNGVTRAIDYAYDDIDLLTLETVNDSVTGTQVTSYTHDLVGNWLTQTVDGVTTNYQYNNNNQLVLEGAVAYSYDNNGSMINKLDAGVVTDFTYDFESRLTSASSPTLTASYVYDYDGLRVASNINGEQTSYLFDRRYTNAQVIEERDGLNAFVAAYTTGLGMISQYRGTQTQYYYANAIGSVNALADSTEAITDTYQYSAYGNLASSSGSSTNNYRYAGENFDSGLNNYYLRARFYNPGNGRFMSMDSFEGVDNAPLSLNKYLYAHANPVMNTDPSGHFIGVIASGLSSGVSRAGAYAGYASFILRARAVAFFASARAIAVGCARAALKSLTSSRRVRHPCGAVGRANIIFPGTDTPENTLHIAQAISFKTAFLKFRPSNRNPLPPGWYKQVQYGGLTNACANQLPGQDCDEYPFRSTIQSSPFAHLKPITRWDNQSAGGKLGGFYTACGIRREYARRPTSLLTWFAVVPQIGPTTRRCANNRRRR